MIGEAGIHVWCRMGPWPKPRLSLQNGVEAVGFRLRATTTIARRQEMQDPLTVRVSYSKGAQDPTRGGWLYLLLPPTLCCEVCGVA